MSEQRIELTVVKDVNNLLLESPGPQGPAGPQGLPGAAGGSVVAFTQASPAGTWVITHNLNRLVFVTVVDATGRELLADIDQSDPNTVSITFATPESGKAVVS